MPSRRRKRRKTRTGALNVPPSRMGNQLERRHPLSEAEKKARILVAQMENRIRKLVHRKTKSEPAR